MWGALSALGGAPPPSQAALHKAVPGSAGAPACPPEAGPEEEPGAERRREPVQQAALCSPGLPAHRTLHGARAAWASGPLRARPRVQVCKEARCPGISSKLPQAVLRNKTKTKDPEISKTLLICWNSFSHSRSIQKFLSWKSPTLPPCTGSG